MHVTGAPVVWQRAWLHPGATCNSRQSLHYCADTESDGTADACIQVGGGCWQLPPPARATGAKRWAGTAAAPQPAAPCPSTPAMLLPPAAQTPPPQPRPQPPQPPQPLEGPSQAALKRWQALRAALKLQAASQLVVGPVLGSAKRQAHWPALREGCGKEGFRQVRWHPAVHQQAPQPQPQPQPQTAASRQRLCCCSHSAVLHTCMHLTLAAQQ